MFKNLGKNIIGAIQILTNPRYLKDRVDSINSSVVDLPTGLAIVAKSVHNELDRIVEKYPNDRTLHEKVLELKSEIPEEKESLKQLIFKRQEIEKMEEKYCPDCHRPYLFQCSHENTNKDHSK